jgi:hypothetical protein
MIPRHAFPPKLAGALACRRHRTFVLRSGYPTAHFSKIPMAIKLKIQMAAAAMIFATSGFFIESRE